MPKRAKLLLHPRAANMPALLVIVLAALGQASFTAAAEEDPRQVLASHGLTNLGETWLCAGEVDAKRWFDALELLERQFQATQRAVDDRVKANDNARKELGQKKAELKKVAAKIAANDQAALGPTRDQLKQTAKDLEDQIKRLRRMYKDSARLAEFQPAREEVIRLANARAALTIAALAMRKQVDEFPKEYERLEKVGAVKAALGRLGAPHRLGTGRNYLADAAERLGRIDKVTMSNVVPIYRDDDHARVLTIVDGATPVTFSLRQSDGPTHLPHSLVTSLNLPTDGAKEVSYTVGNRQLKCRQIRIKSIHLGSIELRDVDVLALPPEGEDLGAKLGRTAYSEHYFDIDFSHLRMTILPSSATPRTADPSQPKSGSSPTRNSRADASRQLRQLKNPTRLNNPSRGR